MKGPSENLSVTVTGHLKYKPSKDSCQHGTKTPSTSSCGMSEPNRFAWLRSSLQLLFTSTCKCWTCKDAGFCANLMGGDCLIGEVLMLMPSYASGSRVIIIMLHPAALSVFSDSVDSCMCVCVFSQCLSPSPLDRIFGGLC